MLHHQRFRLLSSSAHKTSSTVYRPAQLLSWIDHCFEFIFDTRERVSSDRRIVTKTFRDSAMLRNIIYKTGNAPTCWKYVRLFSWKIVTLNRETFLFFRFNGSLCQGPTVCSLCSIERLFNAQSDNLSDLLLKRHFLQLYRRTDRQDVNLFPV